MVGRRVVAESRVPPPRGLRAAPVGLDHGQRPRPGAMGRPPGFSRSASRRARPSGERTLGGLPVLPAVASVAAHHRNRWRRASASGGRGPSSRRGRPCVRHQNATLRRRRRPPGRRTSPFEPAPAGRGVLAALSRPDDCLVAPRASLPSTHRSGDRGGCAGRVPSPGFALADPACRSIGSRRRPRGRRARPSPRALRSLGC